jgi:CTP:molybdopterin cytidylyltransferase MocA
VAKDVFIIAWCDEPGCRDEHHDEMGQTVQTIEIWVNVKGGRKTHPIKVDMCAEHIAQYRGWFTKLAKYDQTNDPIEVES